MRKPDGSDGSENCRGRKRREFFATAGRIGIAAAAAKLGGLDLLAKAVADRASYGTLRTGSCCGEGSEYYCGGDRVDCGGTFSCEGEAYGCTKRMFVCRSVFTCMGPGGGHNCTWRVKFFCEDTHSCSPPSHYHNCAWPHDEPMQPADPSKAGASEK
jgi:hypothetical protein